MNMADDLPTDYDVIVLGTGMTECIVAAAAARAGLKVLHMDRNEYYGGLWASFNFDGLQKWARQQTADSSAAPDLQDNTRFLNDGERLIVTGPCRPQVTNIEEKWYIPETVESVEEAVPQRAPQPASATGAEMQECESAREQSRVDAGGASQDSCSGEVASSEAADSEGRQSGESVSSVPVTTTNAKWGESPVAADCQQRQSDDPVSSVQVITTSPELGEPPMAADEAVAENEGHSVEMTEREVAEREGTKEEAVEQCSGEVTGPRAQTTDMSEECSPIQEDQESEVETIHEMPSAVTAEAEQPQPDSAQSRQPTEREKKAWSAEAIRSCSRRFNLDLAPRVLFSRGCLVKLLISSNVARYAEFKSVTRVLTWLRSRLEPVPCSRADVFSTKHVTIVEKRMLMKLLTMCADYEAHRDQYEAFENRTFLEFLKSRKLTENVIHYVLHAIAMVSEQAGCLEGLQSTQRFISSLGLYGNSPFLWPLYGSGELPQCFCRLCAVFGGIYYLKRSADAIIVGDEEGECRGIISRGQRLHCRYLVMDSSYAPSGYVRGQHTKGVSRGIFITNRSLLAAEKEQLTLMRFPPVENPVPVNIVELGPGAMACPPDLYVVQMSCRQNSTSQDDLATTVAILLQSPRVAAAAGTQGHEAQQPWPGERYPTLREGDKETPDTKPAVLWALYFNVEDMTGADLETALPRNVFVCSGPGMQLGFECTVKQAKEIFDQMCPGEEFLPRAPDPEEIILEDGEGHNPGPGFLKEMESEGEENMQEIVAGVEEGVGESDSKSSQVPVLGDEGEVAHEPQSELFIDKRAAVQAGAGDAGGQMVR